MMCFAAQFHSPPCDPEQFTPSSEPTISELRLLILRSSQCLSFSKVCHSADGKELWDSWVFRTERERSVRWMVTGPCGSKVGNIHSQAGSAAFENAKFPLAKAVSMPAPWRAPPEAGWKWRWECAGGGETGDINQPLLHAPFLGSHAIILLIFRA